MPKAVDEPASGDANSTFSPVSASGSKCPEANLAGTRGAAAAAAAFATPVVAATAAAAWNEDYWAGLNRGRSAYERAYEDSPAVSKVNLRSSQELSLASENASEEFGPVSSEE